MSDASWTAGRSPARRPIIVGLSGQHLTRSERTILNAARPTGLILFGRNVASDEQLRDLIGEAVEASGAPLVLIDQEGGRVQRLRPPIAPRYPAAAEIGALAQTSVERAERAAWLAGRLIGSDLTPFGINVPCLPVADVPVPDAHQVIGDRAYATDPALVARLARAAAEGVMAAGCLPVVKHSPGHGRATSDSHVRLPTVPADRDALEQDFAPFRALRDLPIAMTAHVRYAAYDHRPATLSAIIVGEVIRGTIGFDGLLMTDDLAMNALPDGLADNARAALAAGCDVVLHCTGSSFDTERLAEAVPEMHADATRRLDAALARQATPSDDDIGALQSEFGALMEGGP